MEVIWFIANAVFSLIFLFPILIIIYIAFKAGFWILKLIYRPFKPKSPLTREMLINSRKLRIANHVLYNNSKLVAYAIAVHQHSPMHDYEYNYDLSLRKDFFIKQMNEAILLENPHSQVYKRIISYTFLNECLPYEDRAKYMQSLRQTRRMI